MKKTNNTLSLQHRPLSDTLPLSGLHFQHENDSTAPALDSNFSTSHSSSSPNASEINSAQTTSTDSIQTLCDHFSLWCAMYCMNFIINVILNCENLQLDCIDGVCRWVDIYIELIFILFMPGNLKSHYLFCS